MQGSSGGIDLRKLRNKGFTLVELIVVLIILAILAAALVPSLLGYIDEAKSKKDVEEASALMTAIQSELSTEYSKSTSNFSSMSTDADIFMYKDAKYADFKKNVYDLSGVDPDPFLLIFYTCKIDGDDYAKSNSTTRHKAFTVVSMVYWKEKDSKPLFYNFVSGMWEEGSPYSADIVIRGTNMVQSGAYKGEPLRVCVLDGTSKKITSGADNSTKVININNMIMAAVNYSGTLNTKNYNKNITIE